MADPSRALEDVLTSLGAAALRARARAPDDVRSFVRELLLLTLRLSVVRIALSRRSFGYESDLSACLRGTLPWTSRPLGLSLGSDDLRAACDALGALDGDTSIETLAAAYERLLEREATVTDDQLSLRASEVHERRSTGSYYTPATLVEHLLDEALEPALDEAERRGDLERFTVCDPACGAGSFLVAASKRIVSRLAASGDVTEVTRAVLSRSIYGVDRNPVAAELCAAALWLEGASGEGPWELPRGRVVCGDALLGATLSQLNGPMPDGAFEAHAGDDRAVARALRRRNRDERGETSSVKREAAQDAWLADAWCAAIAMEKTPEALPDAVTEGVWRALRSDPGVASASLRARVEGLREAHGYVHWHLAFSEVFRARGGFDAVLGNPPWIAHAGRAAQPLPPGARRLLECSNPAFAGYRSTHGAFVYVCASIAAPGGRVGLILPTSVADLDGYRAVREAHDRLCEVRGDLRSFGDGAFEDVFQPCMALVSTRRFTPEASTGAPWPLRRDDLDPVTSRLLARLASLSTFPRETFGERGLQTDAALRAKLVRAASESGDGAVALREGKDVGEFFLGAPKLWARASDLSARLRDPREFAAVAVVVRQTARYPIAAVSDGLAFRNTLLAAFVVGAWSAPALAALLNASVVRWHHYVRFRDAREGMPQVKIGHLRAVPRPPDASIAALSVMGERLSASDRSLDAGARAELDELVFDAYGLSEEERVIVRRWADAHAPTSGSIRPRG